MPRELEAAMHNREARPSMLRNVALMTTIGLTCLGGSAYAQAPVACDTPMINTVTVTLGNLKALVSESTESDSVFRVGTELLQVPRDSVTLVTDPRICDSAARALAHRTGRAIEPVWVIAVGSSRYVIFSRSHRDRGRRIFSTFDATYRWLADFL
jgi:hypothetical protein